MQESEARWINPWFWGAGIALTSSVIGYAWMLLFRLIPIEASLPYLDLLPIILFPVIGAVSGFVISIFLPSVVSSQARLWLILGQAAAGLALLGLSYIYPDFGPPLISYSLSALIRTAILALPLALVLRSVSRIWWEHIAFKMALVLASITVASLTPLEFPDVTRDIVLISTRLFHELPQPTFGILMAKAIGQMLILVLEWTLIGVWINRILQHPRLDAAGRMLP